MGEWRLAARGLNFGTRWRLVVSFTPQPFYPLRKCPTVGNWVRSVFTATSLNGLSGPGFESRER